MKNLLAGASALVAATILASAAGASTIVVNDLNPQGWSNPVGENSGGGHSGISATAPRSGTGSVELFGDRTRFTVGSLSSPASNLGLFSDFLDLSFEYMLDPGSVSGCCDAKYSPALRIVVWDGGVKDEFVFEQAYQVGGYGAAGPLGTWNTTSTSNTFYKKSLGNENNQATLATWAGGLSANAYVGAVYVGAGSGIGASYHAYVDNITFDGDTYNFEAVPEPMSWALMIMGFGATGVALRRRNGASAKA